MMTKRFIVIVLFLDIAAPIQFYGPLWSYDDESSWPGDFCKKGGKRQSPIDIRTDDVIRDYEKRFIKHGALKFTGYEGVLMTGINNGHTIQFSTEGEQNMHPVITGGPLKHQYRLEQLHFHWLSEHSVNDVKYPMEIHFVHVRSDLKVAEALRRSDGLAIVSVFCNVQEDLDDHQGSASEELMQYIPLLLNIGDRHSGVLLDLSKLLSPHKDSYYTYLGSLTSPQCNEVVVWIVFAEPIYISDYHQFGKVGVGQHNFRSLQRTGHHQVFQPPASLVTTPRVVTAVADAFKLVTTFFRNITRFMATGFSS